MNTVTFTIDGRELTVPKGTMVLTAALANGIHIPNFCYHPLLKSVGSCRMCYVEIEGRRGMAVSCSAEATEGMVVNTDTEAVRKGRRAIIEFILANHPLDCPTCDKGGECDLQDLTFAHGLDGSRFDFQKARFVDEGMTTTFDDLKIGPEIVLNRNRCILCYKCVRANKEAFGEWDLGAFERGNITQINAAPGQQVDNPFSGNLVEICPVGALTNSDWRYQVRVWLTNTVDTVCPYTSSGSNIKLYYQKSRDRIFRSTSRPNDSIDDGWIADITRYGYQVAVSEERLKTPLIKKDGKQVKATWAEALSLIDKRIREIRKEKGSVCMGGLISPDQDSRTLYSFNKFIRKTIGSNNVDYRQRYRMLPTDCDNNYYVLTSQCPTIADIDKSDTIVTFGSDLLREHPNEYLRIRKAVTTRQAEYFTLTPYEVKTADVATAQLVYHPGTEEVALIAIGLAAIEENLVDSSLASEFKSKVTPSSLPEALSISGLEETDVRQLARNLAGTRNLTFFGGELISQSSDREIIASAMVNLIKLMKLSDKGQVAILPYAANSKGAEKLGIMPALHPELKKRLSTNWNGLPEATPCAADRMIRNMKKEELDGIFLIGTNPVMLYPDRGFVKEGLERLDFLVVADQFETETTALADVVLPLSSWAEFSSSYVNLEGNSQKTERAIKPRYESKPGFEILALMAEKMGEPLFESERQMDDEITELLTADVRSPLPAEMTEVRHTTEKANEAYPIVMYVGDDAHHRGHLSEKCHSLVNFCSEAYVELSKKLATELKIKDGDSIRLESEIGKIVLRAKISEFIKGKIVFVPDNFSSNPINTIIMRKKRVDRVKLSPVAGL